MSLLPEIKKGTLLPLLSTLVLLLSVFVGVILVQQHEVRAAGNTYYVSTTGNDSNPGTLSQPWGTIARANAMLLAGDTVYIRQGTYADIIEPVRSGASSSKITYKNYSGEEVTISGRPNVEVIVNLTQSKSYIVVEGLTINYGHSPPNGNKRWHWIDISGESSRYNEIRNNRIIRDGDPIPRYQSGYRESGIMLERPTNHNLIEGNYISGVTFGIQISRGPQYNIIRNNFITNTGQSSIVFGTSYGVIMGNLIEGNTLEKSGLGDGIQFQPNYDAPDITTDISDVGVIIRGNIIRQNAENAIDLKGAANIIIEKNIIYGTVGSDDGPIGEGGWNRNSLWTIMRGASTSTRDVIVRNNLLFDNSAGVVLYEGFRVYNNTLVGNNHDYTGSNSTFSYDRKPSFWGVRHDSGSFSVKNNVIISHNDAEVVLQVGNSSGYINHNLYYNTRGVYFSDFNANFDWSRISFSAWQSLLRGNSAISGDEERSLVANPQFVNAPERPTGDASPFDFRLRSSSPAYDAGGPLTYTSSAGSGNWVVVDDSKYFYDGFGVTSGDRVRIGGSEVTITAVNYSTNTLTLDRNISWSDNAPVSLPYSGTAPDIGAYEYGSVAPPPSTPTPTPTKSPTPTPTKAPSNTPTPTTKPTLTPILTPTPPLLPGDLDKDGDVDIFDYNLLADNFGVTACGNIADIDGNCKVDIFDYNILVENFGL